MKCPPLLSEDLTKTFDLWQRQGYEQVLSKWKGFKGEVREPRGYANILIPHFRFMGAFTPVGKPTGKRMTDPEVMQSAQEFNWPKWLLEGFDLARPGLFAENPWTYTAKYDRWMGSSTRLEVLAEAVDWVWREESVCLSNFGGLDHYEAINELEGKKSPGVPWNRVAKNTEDFLQKFPGHLELLHEHLGQDGRYVMFYSTSEKEEIRSNEKLDQRKIRCFTASSKEMVYISHRLFGQQNERWFSEWRYMNHTVGMSKWKGGWHEFHVKTFLWDNNFDGDISQMEASCWQILVYVFSCFDWNLLPQVQKTQENQRRFWCLLRNRLFSYVVDQQGNVWLIIGCNKSGDPITIKLNTRCVKSFMYYAWLRLTGEGRKVFDENVRLRANGDDLVWSVSDRFVGKYNYLRVKETLAEMNVVIEGSAPYPRIGSEVTYLSAHSAKKGKYWIPKPVSNKTIVSLAKAAKRVSPGASLERATAIYREIYWKEEFRVPLLQHIQRLLRKYAKTHRDDPEWRSAMSQLASDVDIEALYLGL
uniref:RNA-dependent RNA polymerase n=1 Tax=Picornavirales sp. TaxID=1955153 RepID=A0A514D6I0_9VIRU|nr:MAG: RNA-dependent RNA polymerase [Picornavirales sp.]